MNRGLDDAIDAAYERSRDEAMERHYEEVVRGNASDLFAPDPFCEAEWDSIQSTIWSDLEADPFRFNDLLSIALGTLAGIALDGQTAAAGLCVQTLREIEHRALWGPDHEQEDHR